MSEDISQNLSRIQERIAKACSRCRRNPEEVKIVMAVKTVSAARITAALQAGQTIIAENKVQELKEKYEALKNSPHINHFIGHLQTNKIKDLLKYDVVCIQSLDRLELAEKLQQRLQFENKEMDVFIQVNTSGEKSKFGVHPNDTLALVKQVAQMNRLHIKGLMTIGLFSSDTEKVRHCFRLLKNLQQQIAALELPGVDMKELSMGMSGDLETAIEEGATMVRIGTAVFGRRMYPDSYYWNENSPAE